MANSTVIQNISRVNVAKAIRQAKIEAAEHQSWIKAIARAALQLELSVWQFDGDVLRIQSASTPGTWYTVDANGCPCNAGRAGKPCWHRAARRLLRKAGEETATVDLPEDDTCLVEAVNTPASRFTVVANASTNTWDIYDGDTPTGQTCTNYQAARQYTVVENVRRMAAEKAAQDAGVTYHNEHLSAAHLDRARVARATAQTHRDGSVRTAEQIQAAVDELTS